MATKDKAKKSSSWGTSFFGTIPTDSAKSAPKSASKSPGNASPNIQADRTTSDVDRNVVAVADQAQQGGEGQMANDATGKIKFKRAKKLTNKVGTHYTKALGDTKASRFQVLFRQQYQCSHCNKAYFWVTFYRIGPKWKWSNFWCLKEWSCEMNQSSKGDHCVIFAML